MLNVIKSEMYRLKKTSIWKMLFMSLALLAIMGLTLKNIPFLIEVGFDTQMLINDICYFFIYVFGNVFIFFNWSENNLNDDKLINHTSLGYKRREIFNGYLLSHSLAYLILSLIWAGLCLLSAYGFSIIFDLNLSTFDLNLSTDLIFLIGRNLLIYLMISMTIYLVSQFVAQLFLSERLGMATFILVIGEVLEKVTLFINLFIRGPIQNLLNQLVNLTLTNQLHIIKNIPLDSWSELVQPLVIILIHLFVFYLLGLWAFNRREL